mgnify:CR=1 FL=1
MHYLDKPLTLQLEISSNCNLSCTGCCRVDNDTYDIKPNEYIPKNKFLDMIKEKDDINIIEWPEILKSYEIKSINFKFSYSKNFFKRNLIISSNYHNKIVDEFK